MMWLAVAACYNYPVYAPFRQAVHQYLESLLLLNILSSNLATLSQGLGSLTKLQTFAHYFFLADGASWFVRVDCLVSVGYQTIGYSEPMTSLGRWTKPLRARGAAIPSLPVIERV